MELSSLSLSLTDDQCEAFRLYLRSFSCEITIRRRKYIIPETDVIYFVLDGQLAVSVQAEDKIIDYAFRYMPVGLVEHLLSINELCYRAVTPVKLLKVPVRALEELYCSGDPALIKTLLTLKSSMLTVLLTSYRERGTCNAYQTIKRLIEHYCHEPRQLEGIATYILRRTHLSRGYVFSTLATLRDAGIMTMENGRITALNSSLPESLSEIASC
ncbi:Crp/Fnr family transcriptional regulator [Klebsiella aerogenes]|uniref:Crp/Fnr family transcriptional regulator n=1 Tax=Klebsiella aerogenes TaxID=548 RepID=UPI00351D3E78